jgi:CRP-like cAMP-binding protein
MFGTPALFTDREYPADATTIIGSLEISWSEAELFQLMERHARIAVNVIGILGKRLKEAQERMRELSHSEQNSVWLIQFCEKTLRTSRAPRSIPPAAS